MEITKIDQFEIHEDVEPSVIHLISRSLVDKEPPDRAEAWQNELFGLLATRPQLSWIIDLKRTKWIGSTALNTLIIADKRIRLVADRNLFLCSLGVEVQDIFSLTGLDRLFTITKDYTAALQRIHHTQPVES